MQPQRRCGQLPPILPARLPAWRGLRAGIPLILGLFAAQTGHAAAQTAGQAPARGSLNQPVSAAPGIAPVTPGAASAARPDATAAEAERPITFAADHVDYDDNAETLTASGNVFLQREHDSVRADKVSWNRKSGAIVASGDVRLVDADGNETFTDRVEMTDELKTGVMPQMLLLLREGGRLAATGGERMKDGRVRMDRAAYTACDVVDAKGCPKDPIWRVTAKRVVVDADGKQFHLHGARLTLFGFVKIPLPGLEVATDGRAISGLMIPDIKSSATNGFSFSESWYQRLGQNRDLLITGTVFTKVEPLGQFTYRELNSLGAYEITGYATRSVVIPQSGGAQGNDQFRGYVEGNGRFQFSPQWSATFSGRLASDRTFLSRYDLSLDDTLRSTFDVERVAPNSYFSIAGWAFQTLRTGESEGQVPIALPEIDWRHTLATPVLGGRLSLQANSLAISRSAGQDTQRAFASAQWDLRRITPLGQLITLTALARGDAYHSTNNQLTTTSIYQGLPGWQGRGTVLGAVDVSWPLLGEALGGTQILTPRVQLVAVPPTRNLSLPNEDARAAELEDDNLFALNRFPGYDRIEDGAHLTYGLDWQLERPRWRVNATVGQTWRLTANAVQFPDGTGIYDRVSDIVGRTEVRYRDFFKVTHRYRLDKDSFAFRRNEVDATIGSDRDYVEIGYARLNRAVATALEDLQDSNELRAAARATISHRWSVFGSGIFDLSKNAALPGVTGDGFQPLRTRLGLAFHSDCFEFDATWRRDYVTIGDAAKGNSFMLHIAFRNIGVK